MKSWSSDDAVGNERIFKLMFKNSKATAWRKYNAHANVQIFSFIIYYCLKMIFFFYHHFPSFKSTFYKIVCCVCVGVIKITVTA